LPDVGRKWILKEKRGEAGKHEGRQRSEFNAYTTRKYRSSVARHTITAGSKKKLGFILVHIRVKLEAIAG
jgi:hypothetical protein